MLVFLSLGTFVTGQVQAGISGQNFYQVSCFPSYVLQDAQYDQEGIRIPLDLNGDSIHDLDLESKYAWSVFGGPGNGGTYPYWVSSLIYREFTDIFLLDDFHPDTLESGETIGSQSPWSSYIPGGENSLIFARNVNNYTFDSTWDGQYDKYVGFRIRRGNDTLYGWLSLIVQNYHGITITGYACQSHRDFDTTINLGISQAETPLVDVYPLPCHNQLTVKSSAGIRHAELLSPEGKRIPLTFSASGLSVAHVPPGMYHLLITLENQAVIRKKIVKT